jgi:hypothetical protein
MRDWREGIPLPRITWQDEQGAEHLCVATERGWALEQLAVIEREPGYRLVSCVVERQARAHYYSCSASRSPGPRMTDQPGNLRGSVTEVG